MWPFGGRFFPGTNLQDLNLDWILTTVKDTADRVATMEGQIESAFEAATAAQESATAAQESATTAQDSATAAQESASAAQTAATTAQTTAAAAQTTAAAAQTAAASAQTTADGAVTSIGQVNTFLSDHITDNAATDLNLEQSNYVGKIRLVRWTTTTLNTPRSEGLVGSNTGGMCITYAAIASVGVQLAFCNNTLKLFMRGYNSAGANPQLWTPWAEVAPGTSGNSASLLTALQSMERADTLESPDVIDSRDRSDA